MSHDEVSDETLVARAREGDEAAFDLLLERRLPLLRARVRRRLPALLRRKVAESDVIQAAHLTAFEKLGEFEDRGPGSFAAWLDRILEFKIRKALQRYRGVAKRGVDREVSRGARPDTQQAVAREPSPSAHAIAGELEQKVQRAMAELPDHYREVLKLVKEQGLTLAEAGVRMNCSANAVAKLCGRALCRLTDLVEEEGTG